MDIVIIAVEHISLPKNASNAPSDVLEEMSQEIMQDGWPKGKELGVKDLDGAYEVQASYS
jgi:hypothetical protein